jgi:predicted nucleotidyltransferase
MTHPIQHTERLLEVLRDSGLPFVVVGGVAAVAHGSTIATRDLDVVIDLDAEHRRRLLEALAPFHPRHAARPELGTIAPPGDELVGFRLLLLETDLGRLDVLSEMEPIGAPEMLQTVELELLPGERFRVLSLDQLITVKAHLGRPKDRLVEGELRAIRGA